MKKRFYVVTADHSGLPLALRLQSEGYSVMLLMIKPELVDGKKVIPKDRKEVQQFKEKTEYLNKNGNGLIQKAWIDEVWSSIIRSDKNNTYFIFDQIYGWQYGDALRKMGFKVLGGSKVGYDIETNRSTTLQLYKKLGIDVPFMKKFGPNSVNEGIKFLKNVKDKMLFVFKSDNPKVVTQVAQDSNEELILKMEAEREEINKDGFILQQKVEGIEAAVETWYSNGIPVLCNIDIEAKKKYNEMSEVQTGCAFDIVWILPVSHELRLRTNAPFDQFVKEKIKTGILDLSFIYDNKEDKFWALESCGNRLAYNATYTMLSLLNIPVGEFFSSFLDGKYKKDVGDKIFEQLYGASLRVFNDEKTPDQPIFYPKELSKHFWIWDVYMKNGKMFTTGDESVGVITATGENPEGALAKLRELFYKLHMPTKWARDDFDEEDDPNLPLARYHQLKRLNLVQ